MYRLALAPRMKRVMPPGDFRGLQLMISDIDCVRTALEPHHEWRQTATQGRRSLSFRNVNVYFCHCRRWERCTVFDIDAYLARIGLSGRPSLAEIHRSHVHAIPFENLDPSCGRAVSLDVDHLAQKIVHGRRGGYCFEQNLLLKAAYEALGAEVETYLARVRWRAPAGAIRPRAHLVLGVRSEGITWHADVGFGGGTPLEPHLNSCRSGQAVRMNSQVGCFESSRKVLSWCCSVSTVLVGATFTLFQKCPVPSSTSKPAIGS